MNVKRKKVKSLKIVFEDDRLLLVIKPFNIPTQADSSKDADALTMAKRINGGYLGMFHRLDRPVGGLLLFAKDSKAAASMTKLFRHDKVEKRYAAIVNGLPDENEATLVHYLKKDKKTNRVKAFKRLEQDAKRAETFYKIAASDGVTSLLDVSPKTGRAHQIRAQLSFIGHPILGDLKYGAGKPLPDKSIRLFAYSLTFKHPYTKEVLSFAIPTPKDWPYRHGLSE